MCNFALTQVPVRGIMTTMTGVILRLELNGDEKFLQPPVGNLAAPNATYMGMSTHSINCVSDVHPTRDSPGALLQVATLDRSRATLHVHRSLLKQSL